MGDDGYPKAHPNRNDTCKIMYGKPPRAVEERHFISIPIRIQVEISFSGLPKGIVVEK